MLRILQNLTFLVLLALCVPNLREWSTASTGVLALSGGLSTFPGEFPHIVSIQLPRTKRDKFHGKHGCSGTLLSSRAVVTAAHCCTLFPPFQNVVAGIFDFYTLSGREQRRGVKDIILHDKHDSSHWIENDICIIVPDHPFDLDHFVWPAQLPRFNDEHYRHELAAYGWGDMGDGEKPSELHKLLIKQLPDEMCASIMGDRVDHTMMCAGDPLTAQGTCKGDSGGPLIDSFHRLVGIISWTTGDCGVPHKVSVFTQVSRYLLWIEEVMAVYELHDRVEDRENRI